MLSENPWWITVNAVADLIEAEVVSGGSIPRLIEDDHLDFGDIAEK
jgi:hypothetical protein